MKKLNKGFTLIELIVVIAIIGIILGVVLGVIRNKRIGFLGTNTAYACGTGWFDTPCDSNANQLNVVSDNQKALVKAVPIPQLTNSLERQNIANRAKLFNSPDKISYIYLVNYGKVMAFFTVKGKVSSLKSYMSPQEQIVYGDGSKCDQNWSSNPSCYTVQAPDIDGSYGTNANGVFFFTTEGAYVEWQGDYMMSDQPLKLSTQPELIREIK